MINNPNYIAAVNAPVREMTALLSMIIGGSARGIGGDSITSLCYRFDGKMMRTVMRCVEVETNALTRSEAITLRNNKISVSLGAKTSGSYNYISLGDFIVYKPEYSEESGITKLTCYDKMLEAMKPYTPFSFSGERIKAGALLDYVMNALDWDFDKEYDDTAIPNLDAYLTVSDLVWTDSTTWRDVLDNIAEFLGVSMWFNNAGELKMLADVSDSATLPADKVKNTLAIGKQTETLKTVKVTSAGNELYSVTLRPSQTDDVEYTVADNILFDNQGVVSNMLEPEQYFTFDGLFFGFGYIEFGDSLLIEDKDGTYKSSVCMSSTFYFSQERIDEQIKADAYYGNAAYTGASADEKALNTIINKAKVLWDGVSQMDENDTITLTERVDKQQTGIILAFYKYVNGATQQTNIHTMFIPKKTVKNGVCYFHCPLVTANFGQVGCKRLSITNSTITGVAANVQSGTGSGITYDNSAWALRYVLGV